MTAKLGISYVWPNLTASQFMRRRTSIWIAQHGYLRSRLINTLERRRRIAAIELGM